VPGRSLLVEKRVLGFGAGAAVGAGLLLPEHLERFFRLATRGEGAAGLVFLLPNRVEATGGFRFGSAEVVEEARVTAESGGVERAFGSVVAGLGSFAVGGGEPVLLRPSLLYGSAEGVLSFLDLAAAKVENALQREAEGLSCHGSKQSDV